MHFLFQLQVQRFTLKYDSSVRLPFEIQLNNTCESNQLTLLNTSSFKVPWSNNLTFITLSTKSKESYLPKKGMDISFLATELSGRGKNDFSSTVMQKLQIKTPVQTETFIVSHQLQNQYINQLFVFYFRNY